MYYVHYKFICANTTKKPEKVIPVDYRKLYYRAAQSGLTPSEITEMRGTHWRTTTQAGLVKEPLTDNVTYREC